jgi:hypothetical protein
MSKKTHLKGEIESPAGHAPLAAWRSVEGEVRRPEDLWLSGDPYSLLGYRLENWRSRISERLHLPEESMGLRVRFVLPHQPDAELDLVAMTGALLQAMPEAWEGMFLHSEVMRGPEPGIYLAFENRPPALLTQVVLSGELPPEGEFVSGSGPLHMNILLHDQAMGFRHAWRSGMIETLLRRVSDLCRPSFEKSQIHELSMARSDAHPEGISVGLEQVWEEQGSRGGYSASEEGSRARVRENSLFPPEQIF